MSYTCDECKSPNKDTSLCHKGTYFYVAKNCPEFRLSDNEDELSTGG